jgi:hypothetical protein
MREPGEFVKSPSVFLKKIAFVRDYELRDASCNIGAEASLDRTAQLRLLSTVSFGTANVGEKIEGVLSQPLFSTITNLSCRKERALTGTLPAPSNVAGEPGGRDFRR